MATKKKKKGKKATASKKTIKAKQATTGKKATAAGKKDTKRRSILKGSTTKATTTKKNDRKVSFAQAVPEPRPTLTLPTLDKYEAAKRAAAEAADGEKVKTTRSGRRVVAPKRYSGEFSVLLDDDVGIQSSEERKIAAIREKLKEFEHVKDELRPISPTPRSPPREPSPPKPKLTLKFARKHLVTPEVQAAIEAAEERRRKDDISIRVFFKPMRRGEMARLVEVKWGVLKRAEVLLATHTTEEQRKKLGDGVEGGVRWIELFDVDPFDFGVWAAWATEVAEVEENNMAHTLEYAMTRGEFHGTPKPATLEIDKRKCLTVFARRKVMVELVRAWLFGHVYLLPEFQNYIMRCMVWHARRLTGCSLPLLHSSTGSDGRVCTYRTGLPLFDGSLLKEVWEITEKSASTRIVQDPPPGYNLRNFIYAAMVESYYPQAVPRSVWGAIVGWPGVHNVCELEESRWLEVEDLYMLAWDPETFVEEVAPRFFLHVDDTKSEIERLTKLRLADQNATWVLDEKKKQQQEAKTYQGTAAREGEPEMRITPDHLRHVDLGFDEDNEWVNGNLTAEDLALEYLPLHLDFRQAGGEITRDELEAVDPNINWGSLDGEEPLDQATGHADDGGESNEDIPEVVTLGTIDLTGVENSDSSEYEGSEMDADEDGTRMDSVLGGAGKE